MKTEEWEVGQWIAGETSSGQKIRAKVVAKHRDEYTGDVTYTLSERPDEWQIIGGADALGLT